MAIYNIFDFYEKEGAQEKAFDDPMLKIDPSVFKTSRIKENFIPGPTSGKEHIFSTIAARFFFFLLLVADLCWGVYLLCMVSIKFILSMITFFQIALLRQSLRKSYLNLKRSIVCAIALFIALFSPALGIMFSCLYFLMYDKAGVDEIVPTSLRDQFKELFPE